MTDNIKNAEYELLAAALKKYDFLSSVERRLWFDVICFCRNDIDFLYCIYDNLNGTPVALQSQNKKVEYSVVNGRNIIKCDMQSAEYTNDELKLLLPLLIGISEEILPLGSLVELNIGYKNSKENKTEQFQMVITHRFISPEGEKDYFEYGGIPYPTGMLQGDKVLFFTNRSIRACLKSLLRTSFRQILPMTALKILAIRQYACGFLSCSRQNYARKSARKKILNRL